MVLIRFCHLAGRKDRWVGLCPDICHPVRVENTTLAFDRKALSLQDDRSQESQWLLSRAGDSINWLNMFVFMPIKT
jgi:hypothetical protein